MKQSQIITLLIVALAMAWLLNLSFQKTNFQLNTYVSEYCEVNNQAGCTHYDKPLSTEQLDYYLEQTYNYQEDDFTECNGSYYLSNTGYFHCE